MKLWNNETIWFLVKFRVILFVMKKIWLIILLLGLSFFFPKLSTAQVDRFADCDLCGYCQVEDAVPKPGNWEKCRQCLYPLAANTNDTRLIDDVTGAKPTTNPGHYYTQIGCLNANIADVTNPGAAGSLVSQLLNILIFPAAGAIAFLYLLYGAFLLLTSQNDREKLDEGKKTVTRAIIGLLFTLSAVFIVTFIAGNVIKVPGFNQARKISAWYAVGTDGPGFDRIDIYIEGKPYLGESKWDLIEVYDEATDKIIGKLPDYCLITPQKYRGGVWPLPPKSPDIDGSVYRCGGSKAELLNRGYTSVKFKLPGITGLSSAVSLQ